MRTVHKFELETPHGVFEAPAGGKPLHVAVQRGASFLWMEVDLSNTPEEYEYFVVGTGQEVPDFSSAEYAGTFSTDAEGTFVWHVYIV